MRPTTIYSLSTELGANTIDPGKLNCRVRNGYGCCLTGIIISLIPTPFRGKTSIKDQICLTKELSSDGNNNSFVETRLESFSPLHQRVIDFLPTYFIISDNFRKAQVFHLHSLKSGLKNMAKPHDLLVQIS